MRHVLARRWHNCDVVLENGALRASRTLLRDRMSPGQGASCRGGVKSTDRLFARIL
jgi:hypothetical protein